MVFRLKGGATINRGLLLLLEAAAGEDRRRLIFRAFLSIIERMKPWNTLTFLILLAAPASSQVTASFTTAGAVCVNSPVSVQNTSVGASTWYWSFCAADFSSNPEAVNLGNPGGLLSSPVFGCYVQDANGNFYGLINSYADGDLIRLNFGNSLLNNPTADDLGTFGGAISNQSEGIQLLNVNGDWTAILVGGGGQLVNSSPRVVKVDFGSSLANTPTATDWGDVGGLNLPHKLFIGYEAGNFYGFAINVNDNTITRLSFGPNFTNPPTGINMGNIGNLDYPAGMTFIKYNGNWYCFICNRLTNSLTRLDFGSSLLNIPTGTNIGDPGGFLSYPRDVSLFVTCEGIYGFVSNEQSNELIKLNFGNDPTSNPQATDLGNLGQLYFPHSISDFFRVNNDIYAFIPNVLSNSLTRLRFAGCQSIPGSSAQNPPPVTYDSAGVYTINLLVDLGLPTQTSFCQQITVNALPTGSLTGDTVCVGSSPTLTYNGVSGAAAFGITYTDGVNTYFQGGLNNQSNVPLPYPLTAVGSTPFSLMTITDANGCMTDTNLMTNTLIAPIPQGDISGSTVCGADSALIVFQASSGQTPFALQLSSGGVMLDADDISSGATFKEPLSATPTTFTLTSLADGFGCVRTSGFAGPTVTVTPLPAPDVQFPSLGGICIDKGPVSITKASETTGLAGTGVYSGPGVDAAGNFDPAQAGAGSHTIFFTYVADDGCKSTDSSQIVVDGLPVIQAPGIIDACGGMPVQLTASGGSVYSWSPAFPLNDPNIPNPIASLDSTTTFIVEVTDSNGCMASDTLTVNVAVSIRSAFAVPNAFTPNNDGHNDCFGIRQWGEGITLEELEVFNRWGEMVFSTQNPSDCWDGRSHGLPQPAGGYAYVIRAHTACGEVRRTGIVMLIR
jgi:gliding motility-associated-like protein